jgi:hypothetical protein
MPLRRCASPRGLWDPEDRTKGGSIHSTHLARTDHSTVALWRARSLEEMRVHILSRSGRERELRPVLISSLVRAVGPCPLCPQKRTFVSALSMSALCQKRTSCLHLDELSHDLPASTVEAISNRRLRGQPFNPKSVGAMLLPARNHPLLHGKGAKLLRGAHGRPCS